MALLLQRSLSSCSAAGRKAAAGLLSFSPRCGLLSRRASSDYALPSLASELDLRARGGVRHGLVEWERDGPLVLFLHANSLCAGAWAPVVAHLPGVHAVACDQRAHGNSDAPVGPGAYSWRTIGEDFVRIVEAVTQRCGRPPAACVTHSFAGDCALLALAERPLQVGRMILLDPVLADAEGAGQGAERLAKGTRRLGEREAAGFDSAEAVGDSLERLLRASLAREALHPAAKSAFAQFGSYLDSGGRWRLKCLRDNEAAIYANRVALADHLADKRVQTEVRLVFAGKRRGKPELHEAAYRRDWGEATRVVERCGAGSAVQQLDGVGHFLVLEAPELVAETLRELL
mmetsp:Transcript_84652/g.262037  ORF Transcript_84652/g.262037 Transcript_84652/m.262037 type:complete len:345 (+) Transcript_84652:50-1084(+)